MNIVGKSKSFIIIWQLQFDFSIRIHQVKIFLVGFLFLVRSSSLRVAHQINSKTYFAKTQNALKIAL